MTTVKEFHRMEKIFSALLNPNGGAFRILTKEGIWYDLALLPDVSDNTEYNDVQYYSRQAIYAKSGSRPLGIGFADIWVHFNPDEGLILFSWDDVLETYEGPLHVEDYYPDPPRSLFS